MYLTASDKLADMKIGIVGPGRIGGNVARQAARAGHEVLVTFARDEERLRRLAEEVGGAVASPAETVAASEIVVVSVPWSVLPEAIAQLGDVGDRIVVDTTNQYGSGPMPAAGETAATFNAGRIGGRYTKSFNTLTSAFQEETAGRQGADRVVQWICGDDEEAKATVAALIEQMGYAPVDLGGTADAAVMEAPRRPGAVYGEEYRLPEALLVVEAVRAGREIPPTPTY
jgi:predicted dinucleotide-binding enzyme